MGTFLAKMLLPSMFLFAFPFEAIAAELLWVYKAPAGYVDCSPAVGDLDGDGQLDLVVTTTAGNIIALDAQGRDLWRTDVRGPINVPPTIADLTGNLRPDVLAINKEGQLVCLDGATGAILWESRFLGKVEWGATAIVAKDIDNDRTVEVLAADSQGVLACFGPAGDVLWSYRGAHGWSLCPAVGDLDGDGKDEIVLGGTQKPLVCVSHEGQEIWRLDVPARGASPVLADVLGDDRPEIVAAIDNELALLDGQGKVLWTFPMGREMDSAITVADANGDELAEIYAADLGGLLVCLDSDGNALWTANVEQRVRRSPTVADIDGDGVIEVLVAGYSGAIHVFDPQGHLKERIPLGAASNASAVVADLTGDGSPCVVCPNSAGEVKAFRWPTAQPGGAVLWPEYRLNAARTAACLKPETASLVKVAEIDFGKFYVGSNVFRVAVANPEQRPVTVRLEIAQNSRQPSGSVLSSSERLIEHQIPYMITGDEALNLSFLCTVTEEEHGLARRAHKVHVSPFAKELADLERMIEHTKKLAARLADPQVVEDRLAYLDARLAAHRSCAASAGTMPAADRRAFRDELAATLGKAEILLRVVQSATANSEAEQEPVLISAANPWAPFGGMEELSEGRRQEPTLTVEAFAGETESAALNVFNLGSKTRTFRVTVGDIRSADASVSVSAKQALTLREVVEVPTETMDLSADALPVLNEGSLLVVPSWGARQLWITLDSSLLEPGAWQTELNLRSLDVEPIDLSAKLDITVWEPRLPAKHPLRLCQWGYVHQSVLKDQPEAALRDQVAHGTNVYVGLFYPQATFDENGDVVGAIDFTDHDAYVVRHSPHGMILFFAYQRALKGPAQSGSDAYRKAHVAWLRAWVAHLNELGLSYEDFALYPVDEPGLRDGLVEEFLTFAQLAREADPNIQVYTDPVSRIKLQELQEMAPYVDIWCPNRGGFLLDENLDMLEFMKSTGKTVWTYECAGHVKHQCPLGYYRAQAWLARYRGLTGIGFWSYCTSQDDPWYRPAARSEYLLIYQGNGVVTSKRWEAVRDGIEDYTLLALLDEAAQQAAAQGRAPAAVEESRKLLEENVAAVAQFCGLDEHGTLPGKHGLAGVRRLADQRWSTIQTVRREMARILSQLTKN